MTMFGHPECAVVEVLPGEDYRVGNPFSAVLVTEDHFQSGEIRIEPPFITGYSTQLDSYHDGSVNLDHKHTTREATVLDFNVGELGYDEKSNVKNYEDLPSPVYVTQQLLNSLGQAANRELFVRYFNNKIQQTKITLVTDN